MTNLFGNTFDAGDEELGAVVTTADQVTDPAKRNNIIKGFPGPDSPLVFKIVAQRRDGKTYGHWPVSAHTHLVGDFDPNNKKNYRAHLCQKMFNQNCPECDRGFENLAKMKEMEKSGQKGSKEHQKLEFENKFLLPQQRGWLIVVTPDSPEPKAIKVSKDVLNQLFGKPATKYKPAVESIVMAMSARGHDPYNLQSPTGWIKAWKVGEGMGTQYKVEPATVVKTVVIDGVSTQAAVPLSQPVMEQVLKTKASDLPNLGKLEERNYWSPEDSLYFSKNLRAPDHILAKSAGRQEEDEDTLQVPSGAVAAPVGASMPDLPSVEALAEVDAML